MTEPTRAADQRPSWDDWDSAHVGLTWDDFDAAWSGSKTWDDFDRSLAAGGK